MTEKLTFTAYTDLVLARLYEAELDYGPNKPIDAYDLMGDLSEQGVEREWAWEAAKWIVDHGLGHDFLTMGSADTALTAEGRLYVERGTGIISQYREASQVVVVTGDGNQVAVGHGQSVTQTISGDFSKEEVAELLDQAESTLHADTTLSDAERDDALADVTSMRAQVAKATPNRQALAALATGLGSVASLVDIAEKLRQLVS